MQNDLVVKNVTFNGADLLAVQDRETGKVYAGINTILRELGFDEKQIEYRRDKWADDRVIHKGMRKFSGTLLDAGTGKEMWCIDVLKLPLALTKLSVTPSMERELPGLAERLEVYQDRCAEVLSGEFLGDNRQQASREPLDSATEAIKIIMPLLEKAGCNSQIQLLTARSMYERVGVHEGEYTDTWESKGNWQGTVRKYADSVIDKVLCWMADNDDPLKIPYTQSNGQTKHYHVVYKSAEVA